MGIKMEVMKHESAQEERMKQTWQQEVQTRFLRGRLVDVL